MGDEKSKSITALEGKQEEDHGSAQLGSIVGVNLRRLRQSRGLSLEKLGRASGVSRAMLSQIELGQSVPTINVLWKISKALEVQMSALLGDQSRSRTVVLPAKQAKLLTNADGSFVSRALFPFDEQRRAEFYELRLAPGGIERAEAHVFGTQENIIVTEGCVEIETKDGCYRLETGDAIVFDADSPHVYRNLSDTQAILYLVTYAQQIR